MTSRERMRIAMQRGCPDRIPTMPQLCQDHVARYLYDDWLDGLADILENPAKVYTGTFELQRRFGFDGLRLFAPLPPVKVRRDDDELIAFDRKTGERIGKVDTHGGGWVVPDHPRPPCESIEDVKKLFAAGTMDYTAEQIDKLGQARAALPDVFVATPTGSISLDAITGLFGKQTGLIRLVTEPELMDATFDLCVERSIRNAEKLIKLGFDAFYVGDAVASASLISPRMFERYAYPRYKQFCQHFAGRDILIYIHVCGNSRPLLEMIADAGCHCVEPLDPLGGVEVSDAKRRIGHRVALMGGVNTVTLASGTAEDVRAEAIQCCHDGGPEGYILAAGDMVPPGTPAENLQALVNVAVKSLWKEGVASF